MDRTTGKIWKRYNRASRFYDVLERPMEMMALGKWRISLMNDLKGNVLEVGVGTGKNIEVYPNNKVLTDT